MRPGGEKRGNSRDRRARRAWMMQHFDQDLGPERVRCWLQISPSCREEMTEPEMTVDRVNPSGTYRRDNVQPACTPCQNLQGALITQARRIDWLRYMEEAQERGIEWDGTM